MVKIKNSIKDLIELLPLLVVLNVFMAICFLAQYESIMWQWDRFQTIANRST